MSHIQGAMPSTEGNGSSQMLQVVVAMVSVGRWCMVGAPLSRRGVTTSNFFATNAKKENKRELAFAVFLFCFCLSVLFSFLFVFSLLLLRA
jgi:hypothetical protein